MLQFARPEPTLALTVSASVATAASRDCLRTLHKVYFSRSIISPYANGACRRQIEKSPLAQIEMSLSSVFESDGELAADDGDFDEPFGDRSDDCSAGFGGGADQGFGGSDFDG